MPIAHTHKGALWGVWSVEHKQRVRRAASKEKESPNLPSSHFTFTPEEWRITARGHVDKVATHKQAQVVTSCKLFIHSHKSPGVTETSFRKEFHFHVQYINMI